MWLLVRRPLFLLLVVGCAVSFLATSQLTARLIVDGAISFAFVPVIQILALAVVLRRRAAGRSFASAVDGYFAGSTAWLLTFIALGAVATVTQPIFWSLTLLELAALPAVAASVVVDYGFFREAAAGIPPMRAVALQRLIAWPLTILYFLAAPIWAEVLPLVPGWPIR